MKKLLVFLTVGMLAVGMVACGNKDDNQSQGSEQTGESLAQGGEQTGESPAQGDGQSGSGVEDTANEGDNVNIDAMGSWSEEMQAVKQAVVDTLGDNYWPDTPIVPEMLEGTYGITADMYEDYMAESPMISANVDTLILIKAKEDTVEAVEEALNAYREGLVNDTMQYPMNIGKIQASRIERIGNYVCFVQLGGDTDTDASDEEVIAHCQEQNELAIAVIEQNVQH